MNADRCRWRGWPYAPAPSSVFWRRGAASGGSAGCVVDDAGSPIAVGTAMRVRELLRHAWLRVVTALLRLAVWLTTRPRIPPRTVPRPDAPSGDGPVVVLIPVLPDLSHTFVYREALALLRHRPDWRVFVLARNDLAPVHPEARELLPRVTWLRREGITAAALRAARWLLRRRGRELFGWYRTGADGSTKALLGKLPLRDAGHPGNALLLADQLAELRPRHVHAYASSYCANVAMATAHLLEVPFSISSYVDFEFPYAHKMLAEKVTRATFFRVVTACCRDRLRALPEAAVTATTRIPVILLGLDLAQWRETRTPRRAGTLLSAARLVPKKGLHVVPAALAMLRARGVRCRWLVIGDGPEAPALRAACTRHGVDDLVEFAGARDNGFVKQALLTADLAVLPCVIAADAERDGIPIFLCEAMALGVPVLSTPVSGIPELIRDGDTGWLAQPDDSASLADVLQRALGDPPAADAIGARGRASVHRELDVDALTAALVAEIER